MTKLLENQSVWTKIVLLLGANVILMAGSSLTVAMPAMMTEFASVPGVTFWVSMVITLPALFVVIGGPITGLLTDQLGRKPVLVISIFLGGVSGSAGYVLNTIGPILITRALVGLSIAGATTSTNSLIGDYFAGQERAKFMGLLSAFAGLGAVVFLPIGGILADINWHYVFLTYLPLLLLFPLVWIFINEPEIVSHSEIDIKKHRIKLSSTKIYIFVAIFFSSLAFMTIPVFIAYFMTSVLDAGPFEIGIVGAASGVFSFLGGLLYERVSRWMRFRYIAISAFLCYGAGFMVLGLAESWTLVILGQLVVGFCLGLTMANLTNWLASEVSAQVRGRANGIFVTLMFLGQFMTSFVFAPIVNGTSYGFAYILSAVIIVLVGFSGFLVNQTPG